MSNGERNHEGVGKESWVVEECVPKSSILNQEAKLSYLRKRDLDDRQESFIASSELRMWSAVCRDAHFFSHLSAGLDKGGMQC